VPALDLAWHVAHACGGPSDAADQGLEPSLRPYPAPFPHGAPPRLLLAALRRYGPGRGQILDPYMGFSTSTSNKSTIPPPSSSSSPDRHPSRPPPCSGTKLLGDDLQTASILEDNNDSVSNVAAGSAFASPESTSNLGLSSLLSSQLAHRLAAHENNAVVGNRSRNPPGRVPCAVCGRKFATHRVATHQVRLYSLLFTSAVYVHGYDICCIQTV